MNQTDNKMSKITDDKNTPGAPGCAGASVKCVADDFVVHQRYSIQSAKDILPLLIDSKYINARIISIIMCQPPKMIHVIQSHVH